MKLGYIPVRNLEKEKNCAGASQVRTRVMTQEELAAFNSSVPAPQQSTLKNYIDSRFTRKPRKKSHIKNNSKLHTYMEC